MVSCLFTFGKLLLMVCDFVVICLSLVVDCRWLPADIRAIGYWWLVVDYFLLHFGGWESMVDG